MSLLGTLVTAIFKPTRGFYPLSGSAIVANVVIEEVHTDHLNITEHPVENDPYNATPISDHAFMRPTQVAIEMGWSNSAIAGQNSILGGLTGSGIAATALTGLSLLNSVLNGGSLNPSKDAYEKLLKLQRAKVPFDIFTGKRKYSNMLIEGITVRNDSKTEHALIARVECKEVIIAQTQVVSVPPNSVQAAPQDTGAVQNRGTVQPQAATNVNTNAVP